MEEEDRRLTKKERKELRKETEQQKFSRERKIRIIRNCCIVSLLALLVGGGLWWVIKESSKPLPGQFVESQGRDHISKEKWEKFKYNSNPPTSGPHDVEWIKAGIYDVPQGDGNLVHSLEHGYIIISYNCEKKFSIFNFQFSIPKVIAHEEGDALTPEEHASVSAKLNSDVWESKECKDLKNQVSDIVKENKI